MSHVANLMVSVHPDDRPTVEAFSQWLRTAAPKRGFGAGAAGFVGALAETTGRNTLWGGSKYPECEVYAGALDHADLAGLLAHVERLRWRRPELVQLFLMDQEDDWFRVWMFHGPRLRQLLPERPDDELPASAAPSDVDIRFALAVDADVLVDMLVEAVNWAPGRELSRADVLADPRNAHYVDGWPRPDDLGLVAETTWGSRRNEPFAVGAAWLRQFTADDPGYGFVADDVPELSIAVNPTERGRGLGAVLLTRLLRLATESGVERVSLSVERDNPARRLYERHGFRPHRDEEGEAAVTLLADLRTPPAARAARTPAPPVRRTPTATRPNSSSPTETSPRPMKGRTA